MKRHDGVNTINKADGGKGKARKARNKAIRRRGKKEIEQERE